MFSNVLTQRVKINDYPFQSTLPYPIHPTGWTNKPINEWMQNSAYHSKLVFVKNIELKEEKEMRVWNYRMIDYSSSNKKVLRANVNVHGSLNDMFKSKVY